MLKTLKKFFAFCGVDNRRLFITSIWLGVVSAICSAMRIPAAAIVIQALLERNVTMATLWTSLGIIVISLIITIAINMKATMLQTRAGYRACANKRIEIAEHLRYLPMGWFNDNSLGEVTSVTTNTMENMAVATRVVMVTTRGFLTSGIIAAMMFLFDWRMGLITLTGLVLFFAVNAAMQRAEQTLSQRKFNADERLVSKVLEYVQGIAEVKNFDLTHDSAFRPDPRFRNAGTRRCGGSPQGVLCHGTPVGALYAGAVHRQQVHRRCRLHRCYRLLLRRYHGAYKLPFDADLLVHPL